MPEYLPRIVDRELELRLEASGATLIVGPKWCGKTTTGEQKAKSILKMQDPDKKDGYLATAAAKPSLLLKGENPRLIDEWQIAPVLWDAVRTAVDQRQEDGLFILTGSTSVDDKNIMHTGTGRIARMKMYPMSLYESGESNGQISLRALFQDALLDIDGVSSQLSIEQLIFAACRGGWPATLRRKNPEAQLLTARDYISNICESDISTVDGVQRNPTWTGLILRSYARNISTLAKKSNILKDVTANADSMTMPTLDSYLNALEKLFVIEDVEAWCPAIRSATTIRSGKKREFTDPSIAVAAMGLTPEYLEQASRWFSEQWGIAQTEYMQSMRACLAGARVPQWYFATNSERRIVAGAGVIENDFHPRTDLAPNLCALYVEPALRGHGLATQMLAFARKKGWELQGYSYEIGLNEFAISDSEEYVTQVTILVS